MKALPANDRVENFSPPPTQRSQCRTCDDNGWVAAASRVDTHNGRSAPVEEMAPCPFCERGLRQEFPSEKLRAREDAIKPPWGWTEGYWQGRDLPDELVALYVNATRPTRQLTRAQQLAAIRALSGGLLGTVDAEIEPREAA